MVGAALVLMAAASMGANARGGCYSYEPKTVSLTGTLVRVVFAGPPNYDDVAKGDEPEPYFLLKFSSPICTVVPQGNDFDAPEQGETEMQLVFVNNAKAFYDQWRPFLEKRIRCTGKLFSAISGHHHTPVLMNVQSCMPVSN